MVLDSLEAFLNWHMMSPAPGLLANPRITVN